MALAVYPLAFYITVPVVVCATIFVAMLIILVFNIAENQTEWQFCKRKSKRPRLSTRTLEVEQAKEAGGVLLNAEPVEPSEVARYGFVADVILLCFPKTIETKGDGESEVQVTFCKKLPPVNSSPLFIYSYYITASLWISVLFAFGWFAIFDLDVTILCGDEAKSALEFNSTNCKKMDVNISRCAELSVSEGSCPFNDSEVINSLKSSCISSSIFARCTTVAMMSHGGAILATIVGLTKYVDFKVFIVATSVIRIRQTEAGHYGRLIRFVNFTALTFVSVITLGLPVVLSVLKSQEQSMKGSLEEFVKSVPQEVMLFWQWADTKHEKLAVICTSAMFALNSFCTLVVTVYWAWKLALPRPPENESIVEEVRMTRTHSKRDNDDPSAEQDDPGQSQNNVA